MRVLPTLFICVAVLAAWVVAGPDQGRRRKVKKIVGPSAGESAPDRGAESLAETVDMPVKTEEEKNKDDNQKSPRG